MELKRYFDRVVLINLKRRPDRLARMERALTECSWPFKKPQVFAAIDGDAVPSPNGWQSGGGAWGCMRSHQQILERAIMDGVANVLVIEDDVCFVENFRTKVENFLQDVPGNWDQLMLGGQHINLNGSPTLVRPGIYRCTDCERTHCYAVRGNYIRTLYQRWVSGGQYNGEVHCDWIMGRDPELQYSHNVYAPEHFLVGQEKGKSDINGGLQPRNFWNPPAADMPVLNLHVPKDVVGVLRQHGLHTGHRRDPETDFDSGLVELFKETAGNDTMRVQRLSDWLNAVQWEAASDPYLICTIWHPDAAPDLVKKASRWPVHEITASTVHEAFERMPAELRRPPRRIIAKACVIYLKAPKRVMDGLRLHGWHNGYWRDDESGIDRGLEQICRNLAVEKQRVEALAKTISLLQTEAEQIHQGVAVIWHPDLSLDTVRKATNAEVIQIATERTREALEIWEDAKNAILNAGINSK